MYVLALMNREERARRSNQWRRVLGAAGVAMAMVVAGSIAVAVDGAEARSGRQARAWVPSFLL
jgi:hypothetical protein